MAGPSWLAGAFAAVVILAGAYSASRLAISLRRGRATESDADALHAVMGATMAGMLVPRLSVLPVGVWAVIFGIAAAWFGVRAVRARGFAAAGPPFRLPVPHLIECVAMLYMLLVHGRRAAMAMPGMGAPAGSGAASRRLRSSSPCSCSATSCGPPTGWHPWSRREPPPRARAGARTVSHRRESRRRCHAAAQAMQPAPAAGDRRDGQDYRPVLAPGLAACGKLAMSIAMGYMLVLMF